MSKKYIYLCIIAILSTLPLAAENKVGSWDIYPGAQNTSIFCDGNTQLYIVADGNLFALDKEDDTISQITRREGLSDVLITALCYDNKSNTLAIAYQNSNIDILTPKGIINIPDIKNKSIVGSKNINDLHFIGDSLLVATDFGLITINIAKGEIKESCFFNSRILSIGDYKGAIYLLNDQENILKGDHSKNLIDASQWEIQNIIQSGAPEHNENPVILIINNPLKSIYYITPEGKMTVQKGYNASFVLCDHYLFEYGRDYIRLRDFSFYEKTYFRVPASQTPIQLAMPKNKEKNKLSNDFYVFGKNRLSTLFNAEKPKTKTENILKVEKGNITFNATWVNNPVYISTGGGRVFLTTGGKAKRSDDEPAYLSIISNDSIKNYQPSDFKKGAAGFNVTGIFNVAISPTDPKTFYLGSWRAGLLKFSNDTISQIYGRNRPEITYKGNYACRIAALNFDKKGNLWMGNYSDKSDGKEIAILHPDDKISSLAYSSIADIETLDCIILPHYSNINTKWALFSGEQGLTALLAFDEKETFNKSNDDLSKRFGPSYEPVIDQDNNTIEISNFMSIAEDLNGQIWIGTNKGPLVVTNPKKVFDKDFKFQRIKIARNDGGGLADYLLETEMITAIAVDGANRKWMGTDRSGIYLVSENGTETTHHFTRENSPLPSNKITSIAIEQESGTIFISTDMGVVSYRSDAIPGKKDFSQIYTFPNPVRPDYTGVITITGLIENSLVKITDSAGNLIYQSTSLGGQITWDAHTHQGKRVKAGVYLVLASTPDGKEGIVSKILIIN